MIADPESDTCATLTSGHGFTARLADLPDLPRIDLDPRVDLTQAMLIEADERALDEFVAKCLAQLRQVMDELQ